MRTKIEKFLLILSGAIVGILISINLPVFADKAKSPTLPIEDLRTFAEVFGKIKSDYVEEIDDKTLINEAEIELLKVQIEEIKVSTSNPLSN